MPIICSYLGADMFYLQQIVARAGRSRAPIRQVPLVRAKDAIRHDLPNSLSQEQHVA